LQPETAIADWQQWHGDLPGKPEVVGQLHGGRSNRSYLLKSGKQKLVLRLNGNDTLLPGSNRRSEVDVWQAASSAGLAPPLLYSNEQQGILVSVYIEDRLPAQPEANKSIVEHAFMLLKHCHQLDVDAHSLDLPEHIHQYWQRIEARDEPIAPALLEQRQPMQNLLESSRFKAAKTGLCHHDPIIANFVGSPDRLYLVDWEYAARGLLVMDYAALAVEWPIDDELVIALSGVDPELLIMAKALYKYMCILWEEVRL
jgi:thiamine kinase-like enzyme